MKQGIKHAAWFLFLFLLFIVGCAKDETTLPVPEEKTPIVTVEEEATKLPDEVSAMYVEKGNLSSNIAVVYSIGGPITELEDDYFDDLGLNTYHEVYVHQAQTFNQEVIVGLNKDLSFERAIAENMVSVKMLHQVITHLKQQGKEVYLIGHSLGAFLIPSYFATYDAPNLPALAMAGRLHMPDIVWKGFRDRIPYGFENGTTPKLLEIPEGLSTETRNELYAGMRLQAAVGHYRYMELLKGKDLSNMMFAYGEKDPAVGRLSEEELQFIANHKAKTYAVPEGGHGGMFESPHKEEMLKQFFNKD